MTAKKTDREQIIRREFNSSEIKAQKGKDGSTRDEARL